MKTNPRVTAAIKAAAELHAANVRKNKAKEEREQMRKKIIICAA